MTTVSTPPILVQLQSAQSLSTEIALLRQLKNETIGHDERKELFVHEGIIPVLANLLRSRHQASDSEESKEQEAACLQAVIVVGSLVQGICFPSSIVFLGRC